MLTKSTLTAEEFERHAAGRGPCELVRGEIIDMSPAGDRHSFVVINVGGILRDWARRNHVGRVHGGEAGLRTQRNPDTVRAADIAYISFERKPRGPAPVGFISVAPNLVVEVVGKGRGWGELLAKAGEYLDVGVDVVWLLDPNQETLHIIRRDRAPEKLESHQTVTDPTVLPGFGCLVSEFFND